MTAQDFTVSGQRVLVVGAARSGVAAAHLLALDNAVNGSPMQSRFHADPRVQSAELLLQERIPRLVPLKNPPIERAEHVPSPRGVSLMVGASTNSA